MKVQDIMARDIVTVSAHTSVRDIAALMVEKRISGIPVVSDRSIRPTLHPDPAMDQ
jgi:CBS domain-containing protein